MPFLSLQLIDHYLAFYYPEMQKVKPDLQLLGITSLFVATKLLEISYFDMRFCITNLGHNRYAQEHILAIEDRLMTLTSWNFTQSCQLDILNLFIAMLKVRAPCLLSTVLYKALTLELDSKLISDLKHTVCIPSLSRLRPFIKLVSMLTFKLMKLAEFLSRDFPREAWIELNNYVI